MLSKVSDSEENCPQPVPHRNSNNSQLYLITYSRPDMASDASHGLSHVIVTKPRYGRYYYYALSQMEKRRHRRLTNLPRVLEVSK